MKIIVALCLSILTGCATIEDFGRRAFHVTTPEEARALERQQDEEDRREAEIKQRVAELRFKQRYPYFILLKEQFDQACASPAKANCEEARAKFLQESQRIQGEIEAQRARYSDTYCYPLPSGAVNCTTSSH